MQNGNKIYHFAFEHRHYQSYVEFVIEPRLELAKPFLNYSFNPNLIQVPSNYNLFDRSSFSNREDNSLSLPNSIGMWVS